MGTWIHCSVCFFGCLLMAGKARPESNTTSNNVTNSENITVVLNDLLKNYDKKLRPGFGGERLHVLTDIHLRSMGPVSEKDMVYSIDIYFRQRWMDERLATNTSMENISLSIRILDKIWFPDTVFYNGLKSYLHLVPTPNRFIRIGRNGSVYLSQRLTVKAICKMNLYKYPMDSQECPLHIGSFAYSTKDVMYQWRYGVDNSVELSPDLQLSQFDLINYSAAFSTLYRRGSEHSMLSVQFTLRRHTGYFLIHIFVPCILLVILSWVSFWINREATADRISLGTLTVLTMTFLALENRNDLPRVSYATALDVYVAMCFLFVLLTIVQFAIVHRFTKIGHGDIGIESKRDSNQVFKRKPVIGRVRARGQNGTGTNGMYTHSEGESRIGLWLSSLRFRRKWWGHHKKEPETNSVSQIDKVCRYLFPATFVILNLAYWFFFIY